MINRAVSAKNTGIPSCFSVEKPRINPLSFNHMRLKHLLRIVPICALLLFPGCSGNAPEKTETAGENAAVQQQASKLIEPCDLITGEDAAKILGEAVKPAEKSEKQVVGLKLCMYNPVAESSMQFLQVSLTQDAFFPPGGVGAASIYRSLKDVFEKTGTDIEGVGDEAFIATNGIYILSGKYYIQIAAGNTGKENVRNQLVEAGRMAVEKLNTFQ